MPIADWELIAAALALPVSLILMVKFFHFKWPFEPNLLSLVYAVHVSAALAPATFFLFDASNPAAENFFGACVVATLLIPLGGLLGHVVSPLPRSATTAFLRAPADNSPQTIQATRHFILIITVICTVLCVLYIKSAPYFPLGELLLGNAEETGIQQIRTASSAGTIGYIFGLAQVVLMPLLFILIFSNWKILKGGIYSLIRIAAPIMAIIYNAYSGKKTPVASLFLIGFFLFLINKRQFQFRIRQSKIPRRIRWRMYIIPVIAVLLTLSYPVFVFSRIPYGQTHPLTEVLIQGVFSRIFFKPAQNSYAVFEMFPQIYDFTYFRDLNKLASLMDWQAVHLSTLVAEYRTGVVFTAPPPTIGTFYAQAGWPGVILGVLTMAMIFKLIENMLISQRIKSGVYVGLYTILMYGAFRTGWNYFSTILFSETIVPVFCILVVWKIFRWCDRLLFRSF